MNNRSKMLYMMPNNEMDNRRRSEMENRRRSEMENRFRDRRGREHYDNGRFAPMRRNEYEQGGEYRDNYNEREDYSRGSRGEMMRQIGFSAMGGDDYRDDTYGRYDRYNMGDSMGGSMSGGYADGYDMMELTQRDITEWLDGMENEDGTHGAHWNMEKTEQIRKQRNIECDPVDFNIAMNMMYSDYCKVAQKMSVNNVDFYAHMAKAFLDDKDSGAEDKLAAYYYAIVR